MIAVLAPAHPPGSKVSGKTFFKGGQAEALLGETTDGVADARHGPGGDCGKDGAFEWVQDAMEAVRAPENRAVGVDEVAEDGAAPAEQFPFIGDVNQRSWDPRIATVQARSAGAPLGARRSSLRCARTCFLPSTM